MKKFGVVLTIVSIFLLVAVAYAQGPGMMGGYSEGYGTGPGMMGGYGMCPGARGGYKQSEGGSRLWNLIRS